MSSYLKNWRTILWLSCVALALLLMTNIIPVNKGAGIGVGNGLDYGLDFAGGTQLQLRLEHPVDADTMAVEKGILESRLNSLGLKDIPVRPWGNQYILISVAGASPQETYDIEEILKKQARFE
jgi:preprotein translocase subunit SecD